MPDYRLATRRAAQKFGVDSGILLRLINQESHFDPTAHSGAGAQGIAQFIPSTAKAYGVNLNDNRVTDDLEGAARYLKANLDKYGSYARALSVYNSGKPDAYKDPNFAGGQTYHYVRDILHGQTPSVGTGAGSSSGGGGGVGSGGLGVTVTPGSSQNAFDPGPQTGTSLASSSLAGLLSQPQAPPVAIPVAPTPAFESPVIQPAPQGNGLADALASIRSGPQELPETNTTPTKISVKGATAQTASLPVAHGKSKLLELFYNGPGGINAKDGQREPRGFVSGHTDHVHVAAGPKTVVALGDLAEQMGLHVGENPHFGGVHPVHVKNSNHYKGEAIDVSGTPAQMQAYNRKVAALYGLGR